MMIITTNPIKGHAVFLWDNEKYHSTYINSSVFSMYMLKLENSNALNVVVIPSDLMSFYEHTTFTSFR